MSYRTITFNLNPTKRQVVSLCSLLNYTRVVYNAAIEERRGLWTWSRQRTSKYEQFKQLSGQEARDIIPGLSEYGITPYRGALDRLDKSYGQFYKRIGAGKKAGLPRYRGSNRWDSITYTDKKGWRISKNRRLYIQGVGHIKTSPIDLDDLDLKTLTVRRRGKKWVATIQHKIPENPNPTHNNRSIGVDVGVVRLATGAWVDNETGETGTMVWENPKHFRSAEQKLASAQQKLSRCKRGSKRRRRQAQAVAIIHRKIANQRKDRNHKISSELAWYQTVTLENLQIAKMLEDPKKKDRLVISRTGLNKSISDAGWGQLKSMIEYKAGYAGNQLILVNPAHTSQTCSECGNLDPRSRLSQSEFVCTECQTSLNADVNAARNILRLGCGLRPTIDPSTV